MNVVDLGARREFGLWNGVPLVFDFVRDGKEVEGVLWDEEVAFSDRDRKRSKFVEGGQGARGNQRDVDKEDYVKSVRDEVGVELEEMAW